MGKLGRSICISLPVACSIGALICLVLIWLAYGKEESSNLGEGLWFLHIYAPTFSKGKRIYDIYLWNYCSGSANNELSYCTEWQSGYAFDPVKAFGFHPILNKQFEDAAWSDAFDLYKKLAKAAYVFFLVAQGSNVVSLIFAIMAIFTRWGSFFTWIVSLACAMSSTIWAGLVTAMFVTIKGALNTHFTAADANADLGHNAFIVTWLAVAFSVVGATAWFFTICCVSGRSKKSSSTRSIDEGATGARRMPTFGFKRQYEQLPEPLLLPEKLAGAGHDMSYLRPLDDEIHGIDGRSGRRSQDAYEPFRRSSPSKPAAWGGYRSRSGSDVGTGYYGNRNGDDGPEVLLTRPSQESHRRSHSADGRTAQGYNPV